MWSEVDTLRESGKWYPLSKTLTERAMFQFAEQHGLDLVSVLPSMIVGGFLTSFLPYSLKISQALVLGDKEHYNLLSTINNAVHIDDAASAHIFLFECSNAKGRYICSSDDITVHDIAKFMSTKYPELQLPTELLMEIEEKKPIHLSSDRLLSCGFNFRYNFEDMYTDAIQCCKDKGFL
ncbi:dihydroflavonol 4-reductase-like [Papaver somniferum]|uniref:dihydroflavonol 4-reductase-like n=1 Tax=Papaver somniferum TaxID=3469 RepID=UPI000E6F86C0|nr:dihydroflavonol 4-reductase-like [Papaver somniferum]